MKKIAKLRAALLFVSALILVVVLGIALREKKCPIVVSQDSAPQTKVDANVELKDVSYSTVGPDNIKQWDLTARTARYFQDQNRLALEDLDVHLYRKDGKIYTIKGDHGELDMKTRDIRISGGVRAVLPDNSTIETLSVFYEHARRRITTRDPITIVRGKFAMQGVGMVADLANETMSILDNVKAIGNK